MSYKPSAFFCINSVWLLRAGTAFLISSSKWRIPGSKLCLTGTAWTQALSEAGDIMLLSLIQHSNPTVAAAGDAELPALFSAWWGKPTGRAGVVAASADGIALCLPLQAQSKTCLCNGNPHFAWDTKSSNWRNKLSQVTQGSVTPAESSPCPSTALGWWGAKFPLHCRVVPATGSQGGRLKGLAGRAQTDLQSQKCLAVALCRNTKYLR